MFIRHDNAFVGSGSNCAASSADVIVGGLADRYAQMNITSGGR